MRKEYEASAYMMPFLTTDELRDTKNSYVYFMFSGDGDTLLYVGQTNNLKHRITGHSAKLIDMSELLHDKSLSCVRYKAIRVDRDDLNEVERHYIKRYCPPRNTDYNSPDVICSYQLWYYEKLLVAYNENRVLNGEAPLTFEEAYENKMSHTSKNA